MKGPDRFDIKTYTAPHSPQESWHMRAVGTKYLTPPETMSFIRSMYNLFPDEESLCVALEACRKGEWLLRYDRRNNCIDIVPVEWREVVRGKASGNARDNRGNRDNRDKYRRWEDRSRRFDSLLDITTDLSAFA